MADKTTARAAAPKQTLLERARAEAEQETGPSISTATGILENGERFEVKIKPRHKVEAMDHEYATTEARAALVATWYALDCPGGEDGFETWADSLEDWTVARAAIPPSNGSRRKR